MADVAWFYFDIHGAQQGPVDEAYLRDAAQRGALQLDSMVWREGLASWCPLHQIAGELGLAAPPPNTSPSGYAGASQGLAATWESIARKHPWYGIASCMIALAAGLLMVVELLAIASSESFLASIEAHEINLDSPDVHIFELMSLALFFLDGVAIGFGIVGLAQRDRSKVSSIIGLFIVSIQFIWLMTP